MAKSKLIQANKKMEEKIVGSFHKVEDSVVGGYKKIEDTFVDQFLTHDGETIEEAKERLRIEKEQSKMHQDS